MEIYISTNTNEYERLTVLVGSLSKQKISGQTCWSVVLRCELRNILFKL